MLYPVKVIDLELSQPLPTLSGLGEYKLLQGLIRWHGIPIGYLKAPITVDCCTATVLGKLIVEQHRDAIINCLLQSGLAAGTVPSQGFRIETLRNLSPPQFAGEWPFVTVAVCTRDRTTDLALCLDALGQLNYPYLEILVVDNAPTNAATEQLVRNFYPQVRYVCEPRPGLDWARNRAILEAKGDIIAYTDDDVIVDAGWVKALAQVFVTEPEVMAVTGLVVPYELETEAQVLFERYGGFGRGFRRRWYRVGQKPRMPWYLLGTGQFGTGANMAFRRSLFAEIGYFDPALDVGTVTNGGGDLEFFFRVLKAGHTLIYEPSAIVRHRHRREYAQLRSQLTHNSIGLFSYCTRSVLHYPEEFPSFVLLFAWWIVYWNLRRLWIGWKHPTQFPQDLVWAELKGCWRGITSYWQARKTAANISRNFGPLPWEHIPERFRDQGTLKIQQPAIAVRTVELTQPIKAISDLAGYSAVHLFVTLHQRLLGSVEIRHDGETISVSRLIDNIVDRLGLKLLEPRPGFSQAVVWAQAISALSAWLMTDTESTPSEGLPAQIPVSVVIATYDRPTALRSCLRHLTAQVSPRLVEIIVVDNHPGSGLTPPVVEEFPGVVLIQESRKGLAYARNAGFVACRGEIAITTDDDVTMPPDWLEKLIAPFARPDVMAVTGNVLPLELETPAQQLFENYGGLGRGFDLQEVNDNWFESFPHRAVPTWTLGATANAAFRTSLFAHPQVGLMPELLGAGMPAAVGEDTYLFYKVLKAGYTFIYEPSAYVWHQHRREIQALRTQIYGYSKGHVAYHLMTWLQDRDWRGLVRVLLELPLIHLYRIQARLRGWSLYPLSLITLEIWGNLLGPWSLWQSYQRVQREGRSQPYPTRLPDSNCGAAADSQSSCSVKAQLQEDLAIQN